MTPGNKKLGVFEVFFFVRQFGFGDTGKATVSSVNCRSRSIGNRDEFLEEKKKRP